MSSLVEIVLAIARGLAFLIILNTVTVWMGTFLAAEYPVYSDVVAACADSFRRVCASFLSLPGILIHSVYDVAWTILRVLFKGLFKAIITGAVMIVLTTVRLIFSLVPGLSALIPYDELIKALLTDGAV